METNEQQFVLPLEESTSGKSPNGSLKCIGSYIGCFFLLIIISLAFFKLYSTTFQGEQMPTWTHGPFDMDHGNYSDFIRTPDLSSIRQIDKANKHPLVAVVYYQLGKWTEKYTRNQVVVCSIIVCLAILIFGIWLKSRTDTIYAVLGVLVTGSSFSVWFNGSVLESRSAIFLGAVIFLIGIDLINKYPGVWSTIGSSILTIPLLGFCVPNMYLLPLIPLMLMLKIKLIGFSKAILMSLLYILLIGSFVIIGFHFISKANSGISLKEFARVSEFESGKNTRCEYSHLILDNFKMTARQYFFCSLAGLMKPPTPQPGKLGVVKQSMWLKPDLFKMYFETPSGIFFIVLYSLTLLVLIILTIRKGYEGQLFWVLLMWIGVDIAFFTYFNPWARSPSGVEIMVPIWAIIIMGVFKLKRKLWWLLLIFAIVLFWHNAVIMEYLRELY